MAKITRKIVSYNRRRIEVRDFFTTFAVMRQETPLGNPVIGLFNDSFPPILDGVTLTVQNYASWLGDHGFSPHVVTPWNPVREKYPYPVTRFFSLPIPNRHPYRYGYPKLDPFIWRKLRKTSFDLVHAHCPFSTGRLAAYVKRKQGVPLVGTFHSKYRSDLEHSFSHTPWMVEIIMKRILDFFNACDEVWIPQAEVEPTVREYGYKGPLEVVENGIDFADMSDGEVAEARKEARRRLGVRENTLSLLFVGQHILEKGIEVIVRALSLLPEGLDFRMDFVGAGYAARQMENLVAELGLTGKVKFNGIVAKREQLRDFYAASDLFLFPSFYDNAPLVVREAAALGSPAILLKGSTASEVIEEGVNGFLTERTPQAYADMILALAADRDRIGRVGHEARHSIVRSWQDVVGEVADRYRVLLKSKG